MSQEFSTGRLSDLLIEPREDLDFEIKNWLDLQTNNDDKATFAKAVLALANHGGGFIALGLLETETEVIEAEDRPPTLDSYNQDLINGIVQNYCDPPFHCSVHMVPNSEHQLFPIVKVPGGHKVPIRARRSGPNGNTVTQNAIYVRKPGPRSETPQSGQDWDQLLAQCLRNRRDEMFDQIRDLITGAVPQASLPNEVDRLEEWINKSFVRWEMLRQELPEGVVGPRLEHGYYNFAYEILGEPKQIVSSQLPQILMKSVVRHTGWPPFWYPTRQGIEPYPIDNVVECWLGNDPQISVEHRDAAHSDFWRISPDGLAFLLRGFQEDGHAMQSRERVGMEPVTIFDITLPIWRIGETLLHAQRLAENLFDGPTSIKFIANYHGLAGRTLTSLIHSRYLLEGRIARQNSIRLETHIDSYSIDTNLPEIVHPLLSPLYTLFDFFELPMELVVDELARMRSGNF